MRRETHLSEVEAVSRRHARLLEQQLEALSRPAAALLTRLEGRPDSLDGLEVEPLIELVCRSARPLAQLVDREREVRGAALREGDRDDSSRPFEHKTREELMGYLVGIDTDWEPPQSSAGRSQTE